MLDQLFPTIMQKVEQVIILFIIVCLVGFSAIVFDKKAQAGVLYFLGAIAFGMACGITAIVFQLGEGWTLILSMSATVTAPATMAWVSQRRLDEVIDKISEYTRGRGGRPDD